MIDELEIDVRQSPIETGPQLGKIGSIPFNRSIKALKWSQFFQINKRLLLLIIGKDNKRDVANWKITLVICYVVNEIDEDVSLFL